MGLLSGLFKDKPDQNPAFKERRDADARAAQLQASLAEQLGQSLFATKGRAGDILKQRGAIPAEQQARLRRNIERNQTGVRRSRRGVVSGRGLSADTAAALRGANDRGLQQEFTENRVALAEDRSQRQRADLAGIFGNLVLRPSVGLAQSNTGSIEPVKARRSGFDRFLDGVNKGVGDIFG